MSAKARYTCLFVCTGNLCRSPIAEGITRRRLRERGMNHIAVESAGIHARDGYPPEPLAVEAAAEYGADIAAQESRLFDTKDFYRFKLIVAMDLSHLDFLQSTRPRDSRSEICLLLDDTGEFKKVEVPDPYMQARDAYEFAARLINIGVEHLLKRFPKT